MATEVAGAQLWLKVQHAAFKNRKGYIHISIHYNTVGNCEILEIPKCPSIGHWHMEMVGPHLEVLKSYSKRKENPYLLLGGGLCKILLSKKQIIEKCVWQTTHYLRKGRYE